jgi:ATP-dependent DNA helicase DinG
MTHEFGRLIDEYLGARGKLQADLGRFEHRPEQVAMARAVMQALAQAGCLVVEAGTGTGKTLAYLLPALIQGGKVLVSTGTKNLQEQILHKDLPLLRKHFQFKAAVMKGRANYLCWWRYRQFIRQPAFNFRDDLEPFQVIRTWAERTQTGDRAEVPGLPDDYSTWKEISASAEQCLGSRCEDFEQCFITRMRRAAQEANLVVVNHHLFFADLSVRESGFGEVIPRINTLVFDEAHGLADAATDYFGLQVSTYRIADLVHDAKRACFATGVSQETQREVKRELEALEELARGLFQEFGSSSLRGAGAERADEGRRFRLRPEMISPEAGSAGVELAERLRAFAARCAELGRQNEALGLLAERSQAIASDLESVLAADDPDYVYWCEQRGRGVFLHQSPIDLGPLLAERLLPVEHTLIFTSATLAARRGKNWSFHYFKDAMGLSQTGRPVAELKLDSSFEFQTQAILYLPRELPAPDHPDFALAVAAEMERIVAISRGRAFLLFTSWRNLTRVHEILAPRLPYPVLLQGDQPKSALLREFKQREGAVLFATQSFWEGVDVVGPALTAVVIDKLPFASPSEPIVEARIDRIKGLGGDPFSSYQVPAAVIALKQGLGRLIRTRDDFGLLAVLDPRLHTRGYGKIFLDSLPSMPHTASLEEVRKFLATRESQSNPPRRKSG